MYRYNKKNFITKLDAKTKEAFFVEVISKDYEKDDTLFVYKDYKVYILADKYTGAMVGVGLSYAQIDSIYEMKKEDIKELRQAPYYKELAEELKIYKSRI